MSLRPTGSGWKGQVMCKAGEPEITQGTPEGVTGCTRGWRALSGSLTGRECHARAHPLRRWLEQGWQLWFETKGQGAGSPRQLRDEPDQGQGQAGLPRGNRSRGKRDMGRYPQVSLGQEPLAAPRGYRVSECLALHSGISPGRFWGLSHAQGPACCAPRTHLLGWDEGCRGVTPGG